MPDYVLGTSDLEHQRLVRQASILESQTEQLFRESGIGRGMRVLDLGSGVGDVAMIAARLVGPSGRVVGIDKDAKALTKARARVNAAGYSNISFECCDLANLPQRDRFDAAVGRLILMYVSDLSPLLRSLQALVRSGGILAFQEASWASIVGVVADLPLRHATTVMCRDTLERGGGRTECELFLHRGFVSAGLPSPILRHDIRLGTSPDVREWIADLAAMLWNQSGELGVRRDHLGDPETLPARLDAELDSTNAIAAGPGVISAYCRCP